MAGATPNVLLIIADDLGVHQLGCLNPGGPAFFRTPCLDRFAAEGLSFTQAYATAPVCSPSRASLYTGVHPARLHLTDFIPGSRATNPPLLAPAWQQGLPVSAITLGDALGAHGYTTAHLGKWHLAPDYHYAPGRPMDPESQGFDHVFVTRKPAPGADPESDPHHIEALTDRAIEYCTRPRVTHQPFFCVLAHNALHRPELAPAARVARYAAHPAADPDVNRPVLAAMLEQLDTATGRLLAALRASGRDRDTLVVFTSDHGALGGNAQRKPQRGAKADLYEGGIRVPLLLRWPGQIAPGQTRATPVSNADLFPTLLAAAGVPLAGEIDGRDLGPLLRRNDAPAPHDALYWHYPHYHHLGPGPCGAIRVGDYKLVEWFAPQPRLELFHLATDPGESHDLAAAEPARRADLLRRLQAWRRAVGAQEMRPNPDHDAGAPTRLYPPAGDTAPDPTA
jgi:arylsulfatase A-like enzyme